MRLVIPPDLTAAQSTLWLDQQLFPNKPIYNTGHFLSIRGPLRVDLFEQALRETVEECPGLRLPPWSGPAPFDLVLLDFRNEKDPDAAAERWMQTKMREVIPLEDPTLFRFALIRVGEDRTLWFLESHHIVMDATSRRLFCARTAARYRALRFGEPLAVLNSVTPKEILDAERRYAASPDYEADRRYWLEQFAQWRGPLIEINRRNTERGRSGLPARTTFKLKRADFNRLEAAARALNSASARAIIALSYAAFARLYDRYDLVLGIELAFRSNPKLKQTVGNLARPLPMVMTLDHAKTIADTVRQVEQIRAQSYPHRHYPVQDLARDLDITRKGQHGLFDIIVNYVPAAYDFAFEEIPVEFTDLSQALTTPWLVRVGDTGLDRDLDVAIDTDPGLISADVAARLAASLESLLVHGLDDPACPIASLPVMPEARAGAGSRFCCWRNCCDTGRRNACHSLRRAGGTDAGRRRPGIRRTTTDLCRPPCARGPPGAAARSPRHQARRHRRYCAAARARAGRCGACGSQGGRRVSRPRPRLPGRTNTLHRRRRGRAGHHHYRGACADLCGQRRAPFTRHRTGG